MTFSKHVSDFDFAINYGDLSFLDDKNIRILGSLNITQVKVNGVADIFSKHQTEESKGIKVHFKMDDSGLLNLDKIDISFEKSTPKDKSDKIENEESTFSKIGNKISSFFSAKNDDDSDDKISKEDENKEKEDDSKAKASNDSNAKQNQTVANSTNSTSSKNETQIPSVIIKREDIKFDSVTLDFQPIDKKKTDQIKMKLQAIKEKEKEKRKRAASINSLETFIFDTRDKLSQDEFVKCSTDEEREKIKAKIDEADAWLSEADDKIETKAFVDKLTDLKAVCKDTFFRINEKRLRPKKLDELKDIFNKSMQLLNNVRNLTGEDLPLTETE